MHIKYRVRRVGTGGCKIPRGRENSEYVEPVTVLDSFLI